MKNEGMNQIHNLGLKLYQCGFHACPNGYSPGRAYPRHYLFHYVLDGKGKFILEGNEYNLKRGQGFLICPRELKAKYIADDQEPWSYTWIEFYGTYSKQFLEGIGLSRSSGIYHAKNPEEVEKTMLRLVADYEKRDACEIMLLGRFYIIMSTLMAQSKVAPKNKERPAQVHVQKAIAHIEKNYWRRISIEELAGVVNINRSYLCSIFKEKHGISPQQYIIKRRIDAAKQLLKDATLPVKEIAASVGYEDQLAFSKMFKKETGFSPQKWQKHLE